MRFAAAKNRQGIASSPTRRPRNIANQKRPRLEKEIDEIKRTGNQNMEFAKS